MAAIDSLVHHRSPWILLIVLCRVVLELSFHSLEPSRPNFFSLTVKKKLGRLGTRLVFSH